MVPRKPKDISCDVFRWKIELYFLSPSNLSSRLWHISNFTFVFLTINFPLHLHCYCDSLAVGVSGIFETTKLMNSFMLLPLTVTRKRSMVIPMHAGAFSNCIADNVKMNIANYKGYKKSSH
jgi:hypothetical protein